LNNHSYKLYILGLVVFLFSCKAKKIIEPVVVVEKPVEAPKPPSPEISDETIANFLTEYLELKYPEKSFKKYIYVSVKHQRMYLVEDEEVLKKYPVSTASKGVGNVANSNKTPLGLHSVKRKIGAHVPLGGIMESRFYNGKIAKILTTKENAAKDYVTSRIMWLKGEEPGINRGRDIDSYKRYIYIHGTPEEGYIGEPASHGCIRMKNMDVIELFSLVEENIPVLILKY